MKTCKGKEYIHPDMGWIIAEYDSIKRTHRNKKKFWVNKINRKIRQFFKNLIKRNY